MTGPIRKLVLIMLILAGTQQVSSQKIFKINRLVDSVLSVRYHRVDIDTNYVVRPQTKWTLLGRVNLSGARISTKGVEEGRHFSSEMTADSKLTISAGVSFMGLTLSFAINPAKMMGKYHDYELGLRSYGKRFGFDIAYQDASNFKGWNEVDGVRQDVATTEDIFKLRTLNVNAYYVFNHRRFSYPAAFAHSYIQRRSAGSFLLAASGQGQHGKLSDDVSSIDFKMTNIALGGGYGYNYVPARGWLLHLSALPTLIVYSNTSLTVDDTRFPLHYHFPEVIITGRGSVVKQIGHSMFAGLSMVYNFINIGDKESLTVHNEKWLARWVRSCS